MIRDGRLGDFERTPLCIYEETQNNLCCSRVLDGIHIVWYSLKTEPLPLFYVCLSVSAFKGLSVHETHQHSHITGTHVYFDFVLTVRDYRLLSQYLDLAGKAKPSLFVFPLLLCVVSAYVLCVHVCTEV